MDDFSEFMGMLKLQQELLNLDKDRKGQKATASMKRPREQLAMELLAMASLHSLSDTFKSAHWLISSP